MKDSSVDSVRAISRRDLLLSFCGWLRRRGTGGGLAGTGTRPGCGGEPDR